MLEDLSKEDLKKFKLEIEFSKTLINYAEWCYKKVNKNLGSNSIKNLKFYSAIADFYLNTPFNSEFLPKFYRKLNDNIENEK